MAKHDLESFYRGLAGYRTHSLRDLARPPSTVIKRRAKEASVATHSPESDMPTIGHRVRSNTGLLKRRSGG